ncbi:NAD(P)/FAD-dependent oxidoreductase [Ornithinimicrobium cavernae]|uniref:NAD(P)/FAD-dependent oxidoreductase n=1 Tax=Ornithinimicrobium cavernae TaxID=2666047 RepID=UPI000D69DDD6|nr:FAD-binding oxidoreductase [Ornithinimicrobium cavernae]
MEDDQGRRGRHAEVIVIGAGVIGVSTALALVRHGHDVLVIDRGSAVGHGSTSSSAGIIRLHADDPVSCSLAMEALPLWEGWRDFLRAPADEEIAEFVRCGTVILDHGNGSTDRYAEVLASCGAEAEHLDTAGLLELAPYLDVHRFGPPVDVADDAFWSEPDGLLRGALHTPASGYVGDPALAAKNMADAAARGGARFRMRSEVIGCDRGPGTWTLHLADGTVLTAEVVVNAAGPHSSHINTLAAVRDDFTVTVRQLREELHHVPAPAAVDLRRHGVHVVDGDLGINFRPEGDGAFLVGSNGAECDPVTTVEDPDDFPTEVSVTSWDRQVLRLARRVRGLTVPHRPRGVVGLYDATEDWVPIYDTTAREGFVVAMGSSGNQFKTAPAVGDLMRQIVESALDGEEAPPVLRGPTTGHEFPGAAFSRQRTAVAARSRG